MKHNLKATWNKIIRRICRSCGKHLQQEVQYSDCYSTGLFLDEEDDGLEEEKLTMVQAELLPKGWTWVSWGDGSGCLMSPDKAKFFQYDLMPYAPDGVEFRENALCAWIPFWGTLSDFCTFAEKQCLQQISSN